MKIIYEAILYETKKGAGSLDCITKCDYIKPNMVGSLGCRECVHCEGESNREDAIFCSFKTSISEKNRALLELKRIKELVEVL